MKQAKYFWASVFFCRGKVPEYTYHIPPSKNTNTAFCILISSPPPPYPFLPPPFAFTPLSSSSSPHSFLSPLFSPSLPSPPFCPPSSPAPSYHLLNHFLTQPCPSLPPPPPHPPPSLLAPTCPFPDWSDDTTACIKLGCNEGERSVWTFTMTLMVEINAPLGA